MISSLSGPITRTPLMGLYARTVRPDPIVDELAMLRLLAILRREGIITHADSVWARARAEAVGVSPAEVLLTWGKVNRLDLWAARCELWGIEWVDVRTHHPNPALARAAGLETCLSNGFVPHHIDPDDDEVLVVATSVRPTATAGNRALAAVEHVAPNVRQVRWIGCSDLDIDHLLLTVCRELVVWDAAERLTVEHPDETAASGPVRWHYPLLGCISLASLLAVILAPAGTLMVFTVLLSVVFACCTGFKGMAAYVGGRALRRRERERLDSLLAENDSPAGPLHIPDNALPVYTILVPAYREEAVIAKLIENLRALDYPPEKLDVIVLLEADDTQTLAAAKAANPPGFVRLLVVPEGTPKTKPRACNVGLRFARGEYLVIYDAEDRPHPAQLHDVLSVFAANDERTVVVQARLNYFNASSNLLTRLFALEYAAWFDCMLPGLDALRMPIPLGGTSNHFVTSALRDLGGWDAHNVTEDADLGLRASVRGMRVAVVDSTTWEEACSQWKSWIKQRTRWIKGYMITALVHTRRPIASVRRLGFKGTLGLVLLIAGTPLTFLALPVAWSLSIAAFLAAAIMHRDVLPDWALRVAVLNLTIGYLSLIASSAYAMTRRRAWWLLPFTLLNPFYWCLHSIAAWRALWQLFFSPSVWEKTPHGIDPNHT